MSLVFSFDSRFQILFGGLDNRCPTRRGRLGAMENKKAGRRKLTSEMLEDRQPATRALPGVFRRLRERRGWSLNRLAGRSGVSRTMLGYVETEKYVPTAETMARVAAAFGLTFGQFGREVDQWLARQPSPCRACQYACMARGELIWWNADRGCLRSE